MIDPMENSDHQAMLDRSHISHRRLELEAFFGFTDDDAKAPLSLFRGIMSWPLGYIHDDDDGGHNCNVGDAARHPGCCCYFLNEFFQKLRLLTSTVATQIFSGSWAFSSARKGEVLT